MSEREQRKIIEREFYNYAENKRRGSNYVVQKVAYSTCEQSPERVKQTPVNAPERAMLKALQVDLQMHKWCQVYEKTCDRFKWTQKKKLIVLRYRERKGMFRICCELEISRCTYFRWINDIIDTASMWAKDLGVL